MADLPALRLLAHFDTLPDPRDPRGKRHSLATLLTITLVAMICGCDEWTEIEAFGKIKKSLFQQVFKVAQRGIPSHDTFSRVFAALQPQAFQECFSNWTKSLAAVAEHIAIDGKTMRGSFDTFNERLGSHVVSAYASDESLVLAQIATAEKSNEITAIPQLLRLLELQNCTVTIDAMGTQTAIAEQIIQSQGNYVLAVKGNQPDLHEELRENFEKVGVQDDSVAVVTDDYGHGRLERRTYTLCPAKDYLTPQLIARWPQLKTIIMADNHTEFVNGRKEGQIRQERRFFITNLSLVDRKAITRSIRNHWSIENSLHYVLDVAFGEDDNRTRKGNAAVNQSVVRHFSLNLLKREKTAKVGIKTRRKMAGWDDKYLLKVLQGS